MKWMHYTTRNRLFTRFHLWPLVILEAKFRCKRRSNDPKAQIWYNAALGHYEDTKKGGNKYGRANAGAFKVLEEARGHIAKTERGFEVVNAYLREYESNKDMAVNLVLSAIGELGLPAIVPARNVATLQYLKTIYQRLFDTQGLVLKDMVYNQQEGDLAQALEHIIHAHKEGPKPVTWSPTVFDEVAIARKAIIEAEQSFDAVYKILEPYGLNNNKVVNTEKILSCILLSSIGVLSADACLNRNDSLKLELLKSLVKDKHTHQASGFMKSAAYDDPEAASIGWVEQLIERDTIYEVTGDGCEVLEDFSFVEKTEITVFAVNYKNALSCLASLPKHTKANMYLFDETLLPASKHMRFEHLNIDVEFFLVDDMAPLWSEIDMKSFDVTGRISTQVFDAIAQELHALDAEADISKIRDAAILYLEDAMQHRVKKMIALYQLFEDKDYIFLSSTDDSYIRAALRYIGRKKLYIHTGWKDSRAAMETWVRERLAGVFDIPYEEPDEEEKEFILEDLQTSFFYYTKRDKPLLPRRKSVLFVLRLSDPNYNRAAGSIMKRLLDRTSIAGIMHARAGMTWQVHTSLDDIRKYARRRLRKAHFRTFTTPTADREVIPGSGRSWEHYVVEKLLCDHSANDQYVLDDIDYKFIAKLAARSFLLNEMPAMVRLRRSMEYSLRVRPKPRSAMFIPMRYPYAWICADVLREHGVKMLDQQIMIQSAYPRYRASKADVIGLLNEDQVEIYKSCYTLQPNQQLVKFGSVAFAAVQEKYEEIDIEEARKKHDLPKHKKIVFIAGQHDLFTNEFTQIVSIVAALAAKRKDMYVVMKLHPSDKSINLDLYKEIMRKQHAVAVSRVVQNMDLLELLKLSHIVITLFSTVGIEGALLGKDSIVASLTDYHLDVDHSKYGLALKATTPEELETQIVGLLEGNEISAHLAKSRQNFIDNNSETVDGKVLDRIADCLCE